MGMNRSRPTVADLRANRGKRMMSMLHIEDLDEARASAAAGIDILSIEEPIWNGEMREAAGDCFVQVGLLPGLNATTDDYLRKAHWAIAEGGDCCYCAAATSVVERTRQRGFPDRWTRRTRTVEADMDRRLQGGWQDDRDCEARLESGQGS